MQTTSSGKLALFDLDNTLLEGDSDHAWGEFLISNSLVEEKAHREKNDHFYDQYKQGALDIHGYVAFTLRPVMQLDRTQRAKLIAKFMEQSVAAYHSGQGQKNSCARIWTPETSALSLPLPMSSSQRRSLNSSMRI